MLHLKANLRFYSREHLKLYQKLMVHLSSQLRVHMREHIKAAPKDALSNLHKDTKEGVFDVALKGHFRLHLSYTCIALVGALINTQKRTN